MLSSDLLINQMAKTGARLIKERLPQTNLAISKLVQVSKGDLAINKSLGCFHPARQNLIELTVLGLMSIGMIRQ